MIPARPSAFALAAMWCLAVAPSTASPAERPIPAAAAKKGALAQSGTQEAASVPAAAASPKAAPRVAKAGATPTASAEAAGVELDPMERLRLRLAERLAAKPGAAAHGGTLDLQVGTRAAAVGAPRPGVASRTSAAVDTEAAAPAPAPSAEAIGRGHAEGIAWSRSPGPAATPARKPAPAAPSAHRVVAAAHAGATALSAATASGRPPARAARTGKGQPAPGAETNHWAYEGAAGPAAWGALRAEFSLCANGQRQSPIDIRGGLAVDLDPVKFDYRPSPFAVIDNGHTVQVNLPPGNFIELGARRYELVQFHFHRPSEERIDGRQFEMSLHLVHKDPTGRLAVVAVLLGKGPAHPVVQAVWNNLPLERNEEAPARSALDPSQLLPEDRRYYTYMGSLTTPPCTEDVQWVVMRTPVTATAEQVELFARIYPMNARPPQTVAGRRIMQSR